MLTFSAGFAVGCILTTSTICILHVWDAYRDSKWG